jgi:cytidine deaminase
VIALGANEVPIAGGGFFWEGDARDDNREFASQPIESNKRHQRDLAETLSRELLPAITEVLEARGLPEDLTAALVDDLGTELPGRLLDAGLEDITEFGRAVHAEMDALLDAARRGVAVQGCAAHTTTFPCHNCARQLIAAGIERVVFVESYEKSKAPELHEDSIALSPSDRVQGKVTFEPFVGVAPAAISRRSMRPRESSSLDSRERLRMAPSATSTRRRPSRSSPISSSRKDCDRCYRRTGSAS